jgi:hypothetical protein
MMMMMMMMMKNTFSLSHFSPVRRNRVSHARIQFPRLFKRWNREQWRRSLSPRLWGQKSAQLWWCGGDNCSLCCGRPLPQCLVRRSHKGPVFEGWRGREPGVPSLALMLVLPVVVVVAIVIVVARDSLIIILRTRPLDHDGEARNILNPRSQPRGC